MHELHLTCLQAVKSMHAGEKKSGRILNMISSLVLIVSLNYNMCVFIVSHFPMVKQTHHKDVASLNKFLLMTNIKQ